MPPIIDPAPYRVAHEFLGTYHDRNARRTWMVVALTFVMMVAEIIAGVIYGSMALLADGVHMATHAGALTIAALAYQYARRHQHDSRFAFGTGKVGDLSGFASALVLAVVAVLIGVESVGRLLSPIAVAFDQAILVAVIGLVVNLVSAALLMHPREHAHHDTGHHADHNLIAAYVHVLADAVTSVLAIAALVAGRFLGWVWLDAAMGLVGAVIILRWSFILMRQTARVLLDAADPSLIHRVRERLERDGACVSDLHIWRLGPGHSAVVATVVCPAGNKPEHFKQKLSEVPTLSHVTVEVLEPKR